MLPEGWCQTSLQKDVPNKVIVVSYSCYRFDCPINDSRFGCRWETIPAIFFICALLWRLSPLFFNVSPKQTNEIMEKKLMENAYFT